MYLIREIKQGRKSIFLKTLIDEDNVVHSQRIVDITLSQEFVDDFEYFVLFDENMKVIEEAFRYLNVSKREASPNTRRTIACALRLFYSFMSLFNYDIRNLDRDAIDKLCFFLQGIGSSSQANDIKTVRSNKTVNEYLSIYRAFLNYLDIECTALFSSNLTRTVFHLEKEYSISVERKRYYSNLPVSSVGKNEIPKHIKPDEFKRIYAVAKMHNDETAMLLLILMYGYGLRIGECLGLTIEDIVEIREFRELVPVILLRNRLSDKPFQHCKGLPPVTDRKVYTSVEYSKQRIVISYDLFDRLYRFIELSHTKYIDPMHPEYEKEGATRYMRTTVADTVSDTCPVDTNRYIFLNSLGRPLGQTWDETLAAYMVEAGVPIERRVGGDSLSHRFRHGFAMYHAYYRENPIKSVLVLQKMMRHKRMSSTLIYYNLTLEEEFKLQKEFQEELFRQIPELKTGLNSIAEVKSEEEEQ